MNIDSFSSHIRTLVGQNKLDVAISELQDVLKNSPLLNDIIILSANYHDTMTQIKMRTINTEAATISKNKVRYAVLDMVKLIEEEIKTDTELQKEIEGLKVKKQEGTNQNHADKGSNISEAQTNYYQGDYVAGDKFGGDKVGGDKVMGDKVVKSSLKK